MRLYPPIWLLDRRAITANMLQNLKVEKNDFIGLCIYALHRDPKYWNDPNDFVPTRFEGEWRKRINRYSFMPFGAGPRTCIGLSFALIEIQLILAYLIPRFEIVIPDAGSIRPKPYLTLRTDRPVHMWVKRTKVPI
jgi:cytochrome P450